MGKRAATSGVSIPKRPAKVKKEVEIDEEDTGIDPLRQSSNDFVSATAALMDKGLDVKTVKKVLINTIKTEDAVNDVKMNLIKTEEIDDDKTLIKKTKIKAKTEHPWPIHLKQEYEIVGKRVLASVGSSEKYLGAHVSISGGIENAIYNAMAIGCRAFALFLKNQRRWESKPIEDEAVEKWHAAVKKTGMDLKMCVPHGSYLLNTGSPDPALRAKSKASLLDDIQRCEKLGITLYNFHPGSSCGKCTAEESIAYTAGIMDEVIEATSNVTLLVETMAGQGNTIGGKFEEIKAILDKMKPENRHRAGVCLDTCHIFAAGYDIRSAKAYEKTMKMFEEVVGWENLKAVHVNDCKSGLDSHLDRHENIGKGNLKDCWQHFMNDSRFDNLPLILETPDGHYPAEMIDLHGRDDRNKNTHKS